MLISQRARGGRAPEWFGWAIKSMKIGRMKFSATVSRRSAGFSLAEVVMAVGITVMVFAGGVLGYVQSAQQAEWAAYTLAANSLAQQRMEQTRAAKWDTQATPPIDNLVSTNFPVSVDILDVPLAGSNNIVYATNVTTISNISANPPVKMIRVDCTWRFWKRGLYTNTVVTYRAPDQ